MARHEWREHMAAHEGRGAARDTEGVCTPEAVPAAPCVQGACATRPCGDTCAGVQGHALEGRGDTGTDAQSVVGGVVLGARDIPGVYGHPDECPQPRGAFVTFVVSPEVRGTARCRLALREDISGGTSLSPSPRGCGGLA